MKNLLLFCICILLLSSAKAQFEKGQKMLGGQFSFYDQKVNTSMGTPAPNSSNVGVDFSMSHFASPTIIKGFGIFYGYGDNGYNINSTYGAFYRCTKLEALAKRFYLSFGGTAEIIYREYIGNNPNFSTYKETNIMPSLSLGLGLVYHLNNRFLVTASLLNLATLSYSFDKIENFPFASAATTTKSNTFSLNTGLNTFSLNSIGFGFNYLLKK